MLIRAQEMARYVEDGILDAGLTGRDWVEENDAERRTGRRSDLRQAELRQSALGARRARDRRHSTRVKDLEGKIIATELVGATKTLSGAHGVTAKVEFSWGATEVKPPVLADAIVEVTETGSSLRANKLRIVETVLESNTQLIANNDVVEGRVEAAQARRYRMLLEGAINALGKVGLMLNVRKKDLAARPRRAARAEEADHFAPERRRVAGRQYDSRRDHRARTSFRASRRRARRASSSIR